MKTPFHILIIEDNPDDLADIRQMLLCGSDRHYRFTEASTGAAGLCACREVGDAAPNLVLLDFYLPDLDATDVLEELRNGEDLLPFPVLVLTGTDRQIGPQMLRAGAQDFLGKSSITPESLTRAVENATERWAMTRELRARSVALQASQQQLQLAVEVAGLAVNQIDYATNTVVLDPLAAVLFGLKAGVPLSRQAIHATFHPDDKEEIFQLMNRSLDPTGNGWFVMEHRVIHPDGSIRWLSVKKKVEFGEVNGIRAPITGLLAAVEITERKHTEAALRSSETRYRRLFEAAKDGILILDGRTGRITDANPYILGALGLARSEALGRELWEIGVFADAIASRAAMAELQERGYVRYEDLPLESKTGQRREVEVVANVYQENDQRVIQCNIRDITERKEAEESLQLAAEELARSVRAKDDFLAALSHELRTPLTPVLMMASALAGDPALPPELREQLAMMRRNIELEARLIDDLLDLTRISRGKLVIDRQLTDVHQLLDHTAEIVRSDRLGEEVPIVFTHEAARHHALADGTRLQQVFWNLIKNAVKFTPSGGKITVTSRNDEAGRIVISVADTGLGISQEALPNILKAFEQGDVSGQHRYGGLGLGLAISKAIMEAHGGTILAESPGPGCGATFTVSLESAEAPAPLPPAPATPASPSRGLRLLVVEDHETTRIVLAHLLTKRGHHVNTAGSIQEALAAFAADHFDGVISDLGLPDGSGLDLMRQIQSQRPIPAIALSGYGMEDDLRRTKEAGFFAHLVKPVNLDQLRQLIDQIAPSP
jgi:PAS domain S-box-containing protein